MYCRVDLDQSFPTRLRLQKMTSRQPGAVRAFSTPLVVCESRFGFFHFLCSSFETVSFRGRITIVPSYPYRTHKGRAIRAHMDTHGDRERLVGSGMVSSEWDRWAGVGGWSWQMLKA